MGSPPALLFPPGQEPNLGRIPRNQLTTRPGETTPTLHDTQGNPVARIVNIEQQEINQELLNNLPEEQYNKYLGMLYKRTPEGKLPFQQRGVISFTADPRLSDSEAVEDVYRMLEGSGALQDPNAQRRKETLQGLADFVLPTAGIVAGGSIGATVGGVPGAVVGVTVGGAAGRAVVHGTGLLLTPEQRQSEQAQSLVFDMLQGASEGVTTEALTRSFQATATGAGNLARRAIIRGVELSPEQQALFAAGGVYERAAQLTGDAAYPRISQYARGLITEIDRYVAGALFARTRSQRHLESLQRNFDALATDYVREINATGRTTDVAERILQWLDPRPAQISGHADTLPQGAREIQQGIYAATRAMIQQQGGNATIDTPQLIQFWRQTGPFGGLRSQARQEAEAKILKFIQGPENATTVTTTERLAESARGTGSVTVTGSQTAQQRVTPQSQVGTTTERGAETVQLPVGQEQVIQPPQGAQGLTQTTATGQTTRTREEFPLDGLLHTMNPQTGEITEAIDLGRALQLRQATRSALREARTRHEPDSVLRELQSFHNTLDTRVNSTLDGLSPAIRQTYQTADRFTRDMYDTLRNTIIQNDVVDTLIKNPEEFATLVTNPRNRNVLQAMHEAFNFRDRLLTSFPSGTAIPQQLYHAPQFFDRVVMPEIQYQVLRRYAFSPAQDDLLRTVTAGNATTQQLLDQNRLLHIEPGAFVNMRRQLGDETFEYIFGGRANQWIELDRALLDAKSKEDPTTRVSILIAQFGGLSTALTGGYKATHGQLMQGIGGMTAGGMIMLTPPMLNRMMTDPRRFERLVLGLRAGRNDPGFTRFATALSTEAAAYYLRPFQGLVGPSQVQPSE